MKKFLSVVLSVILCSSIFVGYGVVNSDDARSGRERVASVNPAVEMTIEGIKSSLLRGNVAKSKSQLLDAIEFDPEYAPAYYQLAKLMFNHSNIDSAYLFSRRAYQLDTTNMWYLKAYAQATLIKEQYGESKELYDKLLKNAPRDINAYRIMALLLQQESKHHEAIALLDSAEMKVGHNFYLSAIKRNLLIGTNQNDRAISELQSAIEQMPYDITNYIALGEIYDQIGADSLAEREFITAYNMDSLAAESIASIANFYQRNRVNDKYLYYIGKIVESNAFEALDKLSLVHEVIKEMKSARYPISTVDTLITALASQYVGNDDIQRLYLGHLYASGQQKKILPALRSRVDYGGASLNSYKMLINMLSQHNAVDSVKIYVDRALADYPKEYSFHYDWIYTLSNANKYPLAIKYIEQRIESAPDSLRADLYGLMADQYVHLATMVVEGEEESKSQQRYKSSIKRSFASYKRALKLNAESVMIMNNFAYTLAVHNGDLKLAERLSAKVMESSGDNAIYIDTYGWILYLQGKLEDAKRELRRALTLDRQNNHEIYLHFAEVLYASGDDVMAKYYMDKAVEAGASSEEVEAAKRSGLKRKK